MYIVAPEGPPINLRLLKALRRSLEIHWDPPIPEDRNGNIIGYEYDITEQNGWNDVDTVESSTMKVFGELTPYTNYTVRIAAMTLAGTGPYSDPIVARTREASKVKFSLQNIPINIDSSVENLKPNFNTSIKVSFQGCIEIGTLKG